MNKQQFHRAADQQPRTFEVGHRFAGVIISVTMALMGAWAAVANAQAPARLAATTETAGLEEIVVTGSRIAAPNAVSTSPIQVISAESIATTGKTDIADLITQLPQIFNNGIGQDLGNGTSGLTTAGGVATADLRGLGPNRTLVLVDGRRLGQGSPYTAIQSPAPDLDQIPAGLVERIEVVTGGASAAYGSDAIAGVINFIMKKNFQGIQVDGQFNENWHNNHHSNAGSARLGLKWYEIDTGWYAIMALEKVGLAKNVRRPRKI